MNDEQLVIEGGPVIEEFARLCEQETDPTEHPLAEEIAKRIPIYDGAKVLAADPDDVRREWCRVIGQGPGVFAIRGAVERDAVDEMTEVFYRLLDDERRLGHVDADHYAPPGANSRIWNVIQKTAPVDPSLWIRYHASPLLALAAQAWLGPWYQITTQVNIVHPGGKAQSPHRDYHLGFVTAADVVHFPAHAHELSKALTLQGAVAHTTMPIESGPTIVLPYSQLLADGYLRYRNAELVSYFGDHAVQLELEVGDAVFFNPGLHHAAGTNHTEHDRVGNLFQISSAMGIAMESVDRYAIASAVYPAMLAAGLDDRWQACAIAASADGYAFPTNVDTDPPVGGLAPRSAQSIMLEALRERWDPAKFDEVLDAHRLRRRP